MLSLRQKKLILIQSITLSRALAGLGFITIALNCHNNIFSTALLSYACISDMLDGFVARKLSSTSNTGGILDLFGDKFLTIISLTYAIARGMPILPCSLAILREVFLLSMRNILLDGKPLFPPQRLLGTLTILPVWLGAILLLQAPEVLQIPLVIFKYYYWMIGLIFLSNLVYKITYNWKQILLSFEQ